MLSQLSADYFARSPVMAFPIAALGLFLLVFIGVSIWAMSRTQRDIEHLAALPLDGKGEDHG
ncbi:MAG TPA: hypothetical protein VFN67_08755 [Polyangiales bacterium]|nr:hypothetical protein [Polyangiales bacterium]